MSRPLHCLRCLRVTMNSGTMSSSPNVGLATSATPGQPPLPRQLSGRASDLLESTVVLFVCGQFLGWPLCQRFDQVSQDCGRKGHAQIRTRDLLICGQLRKKLKRNAVTAGDKGRKSAGNAEVVEKRTMTPAGLEPAIPGSVGRCLIHWATGPLAATKQ